MQVNTARLLIRPVCMEDKEAMYRYRSHPETNRYLSLIPQTVDDVAEFIGKTSSMVNVPGTWFQCVVIEKASQTLIGDIGIHFLDTDPENRQAEIGYTLDREFRGKGYATEALTAIIGYLFHSLDKHRIIASIDPVNTDSVRLIERLGFRKEGHFRESIFFHGKWVDDLVYAILAKEWKGIKRG